MNIRILLSCAVLAGVAACTSSPREEAIEPGHYSSPLVQLQQLVGKNDHLHTDEVRYRRGDGKLFHCSYTFGVIDARDPQRMAYLAEDLRHTIPGDSRRPGCIHLAWDGDIVYTVHRGNIDNPAFLSGWILRPNPKDPEKLSPVQLPVMQEPGVSYEGIDVSNGFVYVALRQNGLGIYQRDATNHLKRIGTASGLSNAWGVRVRGNTAFVSDGLNGLAIFDVTDPKAPVLRGRAAIGGQARGLAVDGDRVYVAAGSGGLVIVDVSALDAPKVLGSARVAGSAIRVDYSDGRAYVAAWNDARVYDVSNPAKPRFIGAARMTRDLSAVASDFIRTVPNPAEAGSHIDEAESHIVTSRTLGVAANGDVMFAGNWHVIHSFRLYPGRIAPSIVLPEETNLVDFGPVPAGTRREVPLAIKNQGTAPLTVFGVKTSHPAFAAAPQALRVAPGQTGILSISYAAPNGNPEKATAFLDLSTDDPENQSRRGYLVANQPGLGIGRALPETNVALVDGGQWSSTEANGQVTLLAYFATF